MTVYVDDMRVPAKVGKIRARWSHLYSDDDDAELHAFATRLGMKRSWFQDGGTPTSHYDVTDTMRAKAIELGAVPIGCFSPEAITIMEAKFAAHGEVLSARQAHRRGLCVNCKSARHSPGRTRCDACHADCTNPARPPAGRS